MSIQSMFYFYLVVLHALATFLLYRAFHMNLPKREPLLQRIKYQNLQVKKILVPTELVETFKKSGNPLHLTAEWFQLIRYVISFSWLIMNLFSIFITGGKSPIAALFMISLPVIFLAFLTNPKRKLMLWVFNLYRQKREHSKNQDLFMLYGMITDEIKESGNSIPNIPGILRKLRHYTPHIRSSINRGLRNTNQGVGVVMNSIADDIGTKEAIELCKILSDLEQANQGNLHEIITSRENSYISTLRANRKKRRMRFGNLITPIIFIPLLVYVMDILVVVINLITGMTEGLTNLN